MITDINANELLETFITANRAALQPEGIRIPNMVRRNAEGGLTVSAIAMPPEEFYKQLVNVLVREQPRELVYGLDRYATPEDALITQDFFSVHHWNAGAWRIGIILYQHHPPHWSEIFWEHPRLCGAGGKLATEMESAFSRAKVFRVSTGQRLSYPSLRVPLTFVPATERN